MCICNRFHLQVLYCWACSINLFWVSGLIHFILYDLQSFISYVHFRRFIITAQVLIVSCKDNNWITVVGTNICCDCCNIFFLFLWGEVLYMFCEFIFMKFIFEKWTRKYYLFISLKRKVMNLTSKIKKKKKKKKNYVFYCKRKK